MQLSNRPLLIGVTGNIGSGKTLFCKQIEQHYTVVYSDKIADQILNTSPIVNQLINHWGHIILKNEKLDKSMIAKIVFSNGSELNYLNNLIHPEVLKVMQNIVDISHDSVLFFEVPLLFETKLEKCFDHVVLIVAEEVTRMERLLHKGNMSYSDIESKVKNQMKDNDKKSLSDTIIENNQSETALYKAADDFVMSISKIRYKSICNFTSSLTLND